MAYPSDMDKGVDMDIQSHAALLRSEWTAIRERTQRNEPVVLDGKTLDIPEVIRVCLYEPSFLRGQAVSRHIQE